MKDFIHKMLKAMNLGGRDWAVLLSALLLAFSTWLIHNLSLKYNDYLTASVIAQCNIEGHSNISLNRSDVIARCRATGYKVIMSDIRARRAPVTVNFAPAVMRHMEDDLFYVLSSDLTEYTHMIYGDGVTLEHYVSDTLFFRFPSVDYKKVPVTPVYSVSYRPQHMSDGQLQVAPDSVTIYGMSQRLENVTQVFTEPIKHSDLVSDVQGVVRLEKLKDVRVSAEEVHYMLDVKRYVDIVTTLPLNVLNVPADKKLQVFPSSVTVTLKLPFPLASDPENGIGAYVDYNDYVQSLSGMCKVRLSGAPKGLLSYECDPVAVGCVLEDR